MDRTRATALQFPEDDGIIILEYFVTDATKVNMTTKTYVVNFEPKSVEECPIKLFCQNITQEHEYPCPELAMHPVAMFRDPFRKGKNKIVLCEYKYMSGKPPDMNTRVQCKEILDQVSDQEPWFGLEQEYYFVDDKDEPFDWELKVQNPDIDVNCELFLGRHVALQREIVEIHFRACIYAGIKMYGMNREATPSEWEYQLQPLSGIEAADQLHVSRYILMRISEMYGIKITFYNPECTRAYDSRSTLHINFSTKKMRQDGGIAHIHKAIENLGKHPQERLLKYFDLKNGNDASWRLSGECYMPKHDVFVCKVGDKSDCSVRIPSDVAQAGKGYFEDRRPSSEACPYDACRVFTLAALFDTNGF